jgi:hypothetical protein
MHLRRLSLFQGEHSVVEVWVQEEMVPTQVKSAERPRLLQLPVAARRLPLLVVTTMVQKELRPLLRLHQLVELELRLVRGCAQTYTTLECTYPPSDTDSMDCRRPQCLLDAYICS